jgi:predicted dinucleotide-binding enzyme
VDQFKVGPRPIPNDLAFMVGTVRAQGPLQQSAHSLGANREAARFGEVVFVAVPFGAWPALAKEIGPEIEGKVVADAGNLYPARDGKMAAAASILGRFCHWHAGL